MAMEQPIWSFLKHREVRSRAFVWCNETAARWVAALRLTMFLKLGITRYKRSMPAVARLLMNQAPRAPSRFIIRAPTSRFGRGIPPPLDPERGAVSNLIMRVALARSPSDAWEIGRASCRERA